MNLRKIQQIYFMRGVIMGLEFQTKPANQRRKRNPHSLV
jgi:hypothetical protein